MKKLRFISLFCIYLAVLTLSGCAEPEKQAPSRTVTLMTWNVHNLFDGKDDGYEYAEFLQSSGWSDEKYKSRINSISSAIGQTSPLPDIILLQEIESLQVLEDLALSLHRGFSWSHFANNPGAAIGLGIISRFPLLDATAHTITVGNDTTPRPVLEVRVSAMENEFVIFICHWKSKIGGDDATEKVRRASARAILRRSREILESEPEIGIIVAGDLNLNHDEFSRRGSNVICALLPDNPYSALLAGAEQKDFIVITGDIPPKPRFFPQDAIVFYSPWEPPAENQFDEDIKGLWELEKGTYFYRNNWETIDHFLISHHFFSNSNLQYINTLIADYPPFVNAGGMPFAYNVRTGSGLSDHLPLVFVLGVGE
ncbi:MAG: endonuclease/exonuclease/phosphatase family protein [Treponema sp.]|nr:endonuclease/exonuclease/phosphatase family protein [Treponema sp.]